MRPDPDVPEAFQMTLDEAREILRTLSARCPRSTGDLMDMALGRWRLSAASAELALALFHERTGQHDAARAANGAPCDGCDLFGAARTGLLVLRDWDRVVKENDRLG